MTSHENQAEYTPEAPRQSAQSAELSREVMSFAPTNSRQDNDFGKNNSTGTDKLSSTTGSSMQVAPIWASVWQGNGSEQDQLDQGRMKNPYQNLLAQQIEAQWSPNQSLDQNVKISAPGAAQTGDVRNGADGATPQTRLDGANRDPRALFEAGRRDPQALREAGQQDPQAQLDAQGRQGPLTRIESESQDGVMQADARRRPDSSRRGEPVPEATRKEPTVDLKERPKAPSEPKLDQAPEGDKTPPAEGDKTTPKSETGSRIAGAADRMMDQQVWRGTKHERSVHQGKLGGAASVSRILQGEGYNYADSANVGNLTDQLSSNGWQLVGTSQMKAGDVIFGGKVGTNWKAGGGNARIGIVGEDGKIYHNDPETGKWTKSSPEDAFKKGVFGDQVWTMRPPEGGAPNQEQQAGPEGQRVRGQRDGGRQDRQEEQRRRNEGQEEGERPQRRHRERGGEQPERGERPGRRGRRGESDRPPEREEQQPNNDRNRREPQGPLGDASARNLRSAKEHVGDQLWRNGYGLGNGNLGCAAAVSEVLKDAGQRGVHSAGVAQVAEQLTAKGWTQHSGLDKAEPGDVVVIARRSGWRNGGGGAHIGVVGENGKVYHNRSSTGRWTEDSLQRTFGGGMSRFILKPPRS